MNIHRGPETIEEKNDFTEILSCPGHFALALEGRRPPSGPPPLPLSEVLKREGGGVFNIMYLFIILSSRLSPILLTLLVGGWSHPAHTPWTLSCSLSTMPSKKRNSATSARLSPWIWMMFPNSSSSTMEPLQLKFFLKAFRIFL